MIKSIQVSHPQPGVARIEIDCPPVNALTSSVIKQLTTEIDAIDKNHDTRVLILTGSENRFCAGADFGELGKEGVDSALGESFSSLLDQIEGLRVPVIAAVNGHSLGGGFELALVCDIRIASTSAFFVGAAVNVGLIASVYRLPRLIGPARAKHVLLTGSRISAQTALEYGIVTEVHAPELLSDAALTIANRIATRAPLSVEATKRLIGKALDMNREEADHCLSMELAPLTMSEDHKEALSSFANNRVPHFKRR